MKNQIKLLSVIAAVVFATACNNSGRYKSKQPLVVATADATCIILKRFSICELQTQYFIHNALLDNIILNSLNYGI